MQVLDISTTNFSQACSANSKLRGGSDEPIAVGRLTNLAQYSSCLPNFLKFDTNTLRRAAYAENFICPAVRWNNQAPEDGTLNSSELAIQVRPMGHLPQTASLLQTILL